MNSRISDVAKYTATMLRNLGNFQEDAKKIEDANRDLDTTIGELKGLKWDSLFAVKDDKRHELTTRQQNVIKQYAKLKLTLLEIYRDLFKAIKEDL
jgi:hypothetical protein